MTGVNYYHLRMFLIERMCVFHFPTYSKIDLTSAKVSPSEVYQDSVGSVSIDPDVVSNRTFIIL